MPDSIVKKVDDLADLLGQDQRRQDNFLSKIAPPDADKLTNKTLVMAGSLKKAGYLSQDATAFYDSASPAGSNVDYLIKQPSFTLSTPDTDTAINAGGEGSLELHINDILVDTFDLAAAFVEAQVDGNQNYTPANGVNGKITVLTVGVYNSIWQKLTCKATITSADLRKGYNKIVMKHVGTPSGDQVSRTYQVFWDNAPVDPVMSAVALAIHSETPKYLSGVRFLGQNSQVKVSTSVSNIADNSYVLNPVDFYSLIGAPTETVAPSDSSVTGLSNPIVVGETMSITNKIIALSTANQCTKDAVVTGRPRDPFATYGAVNSASQNLLISTFGTRSTNTAEYFDDEKYRLDLSWNPDDKTSPVTNHWDSEALLTSGNAQQFVSADNEHSLMYPSINFGSYKPVNTANYSAFSGAQKYLRCIVGSSAKSSIKLTLDGTTGGIGLVGSGDVNVEVKLAGETGWLDCAKAYNGTSVSNDGDGCLVGGISYSGGKATINCTFGTKSSFGANNRCYIRITLNNGTRIVKSIVTNW